VWRHKVTKVCSRSLTYHFCHTTNSVCFMLKIEHAFNSLQNNTVGYEESRVRLVRRLDSQSRGDKNMRNATVCGRGYYLANLATQAQYEKIINSKRFNVCHINKILPYAFKTLFIHDSRISLDKSARMGILEYFVTSNPKCDTACASHHQGHRLPRHADLPPADRDICRRQSYEAHSATETGLRSSRDGAGARHTLFAYGPRALVRR